MPSSLPAPVKGSAQAEKLARERGYKDYDTMRAFVLAQQRGNTDGAGGGGLPMGRMPNMDINQAFSWTPKRLLEHVYGKIDAATRGIVGR